MNNTMEDINNTAEFVVLIITTAVGVLINLLNTVSNYSHLKRKDKEFISKKGTKHIAVCCCNYESDTEEIPKRGLDDGIP